MQRELPAQMLRRAEHGSWTQGGAVLSYALGGSNLAQRP